MFRKIHSNREPGTSVYQEIKKEFGIYFDRGEGYVRKVTTNYPNQVYAVMVFAMVVSIGLSFTYFRNQKGETTRLSSPALELNRRPAPITGQLSQLLETTSLLKETLELKRHINGILSKEELTPTDSMELVKALDRLRIIQKPIKPNK